MIVAILTIVAMTVSKGNPQSPFIPRSVDQLLLQQEAPFPVSFQGHVLYDLQNGSQMVIPPGYSVFYDDAGNLVDQSIYTPIKVSNLMPVILWVAISGFSALLCSIQLSHMLKVSRLRQG